MTMNPDWLLKHFEQISEAPEPVSRLRRFYLEYSDRAVQIPQTPSGESQSSSPMTTSWHPFHISQTPSAQLAAFPLSWFQYQLYLSCKEDLKKRLIEWAEAALQNKSGDEDDEP